MGKNIQKKQIIRALKIALGSSAAIYIASLLELDYEISAGTIALLTIVSTKLETMRLSLHRVITLLFTIGMSWIVFGHLRNEWAAYGIFIFTLVLVSDMLGWGATISVNAVIAAHFLTRLEFSREFIINEVLLVLIGVTLAILVNLFSDRENSKKALISHMRLVEEHMQKVLEEIAEYLMNKEMTGSVWSDISGLQDQITEYVVEAAEYRGNTFSSHPEYYIDYFEMRGQQCSVLQNLHYELKKMRKMPEQAKIIADYILYMKEFVVEKNTPVRQLEFLDKIVKHMADTPLPVTREEFEGQAILYHILMDLEDFLLLKKRFVENLSEQQRLIYWKTNFED